MVKVLLLYNQQRYYLRTLPIDVSLSLSSLDIDVPLNYQVTPIHMPQLALLPKPIICSSSVALGGQSGQIF